MVRLLAIADSAPPVSFALLPLNVQPWMSASLRLIMTGDAPLPTAALPAPLHGAALSL